MDELARMDAKIVELLRGGVQEVKGDGGFTLADIEAMLRAGQVLPASRPRDLRRATIPAGVVCPQCKTPVTSFREWGALSPCGHLGDPRELVERADAVNHLRAIAERSLNEA